MRTHALNQKAEALLDIRREVWVVQLVTELKVRSVSECTCELGEDTQELFDHTVPRLCVVQNLATQASLDVEAARPLLAHPTTLRGRSRRALSVVLCSSDSTSVRTSGAFVVGRLTSNWNTW